MDDRTQLQRLAQEVEVLRKRLDEINLRIEQVDAVLSEHTITEAVLQALVSHDQERVYQRTFRSVRACVCRMFTKQNKKALPSLIWALVCLENARGATQKPSRKNDVWTSNGYGTSSKNNPTLTESSLGEAAQTFNKLAEQMKKPPTPQPSPTVPSETKTHPFSPTHPPFP